MAHLCLWRARTPFVRVVSAWLLVGALLALAGCQQSPGTSQPQGGGNPGSSLRNLPAVTQATPSPMRAGWGKSRQAVGNITYSFEYPPTDWTADLSYCAPEATKGESGHFDIPAACAVTEILVGQKARDLGQLPGQPLTINGKRSIKHVDTKPKSDLASRIYTVMVYDDDGTPLFGFSTSIGRGTHVERQEMITADLDLIAGTVSVERSR